MERQWRRRSGFRRRSGVALALGALLQLGLPGSAEAENLPDVDLDPSDRVLALEERGCGETQTAEPRCSDLAVALGRQRGTRARTFGEATATLPAKLRTECDVKAEDIGWPATWIRCFDRADTDQTEWLTQGIAGTGEWRTAESPGARQHYLIATWCWRGSEGIDEADVCNREEPVKRTRISLISVDRNAYRNVELVEPYLEQAAGRSPVVASRGILLHAGGAAIAGRWLYVADTEWLYVFNLDHFLQSGDRPYQLPVWARYVIADPADRERNNPFSSISIDGSGDEPRLVAAEYRLDSREDALVTVWPLERDGRLPDARPVRTTRSYTIDGGGPIDRVQGVAAHGDTFLFAESAETIERAPAGARRQAGDRCIKWGDGTGEDLYASAGEDVVVGINEGFLATGSTFWAVPYRSAFGLEPPPQGYPRRDC
ncbi:MAG TPA: hypothetical protein VEG38_13715 [Acidimicrobiia bacterium]|nr:hypothetical protein [Acidimicrobiia bacterium]